MGLGTEAFWFGAAILSLLAAACGLLCLLFRIFFAVAFLSIWHFFLSVAWCVVALIFSSQQLIQLGVLPFLLWGHALSL